MAAAKTKTEPKTEAPEQAHPIARLAPSRMPIVASIAKEFDVTPDQWRVLVDQLFPAARTVEAIGMALAYCRARNLDIFKKPVHIVPMWSTALRREVETVWPGIAEVRTTAARTGEYAGIDEPVLGPMVDKLFEHQFYDERTGQPGNKITKQVRFPEWASVVVYRLVGGQPRAFHAKIWWTENYATVGKTEVPNDMWARRSIGQFLKCLEAAALRMAFPEELGSTYVAEEMEGKTIEGMANAVTVPTTKPSDAMPEIPPGDKPAAAEAKKPELHNSDQPEGAKNEAGADDFNADDSAIATPELTAEDRATLAELEALLAEQVDEATVEQAFDDFDVQTVFADSEAGLGAAFEIKKRRLHDLARGGTPAELAAAGQGDMFGGNPPEIPRDDGSTDQLVDSLFPGARAP